MAQAQKDRASRRYPPPIQQRNKKDQLYNDVLSYCEENQIGWIGDEVDSLAITFLRSVTDVLWYIDGHHHVFAGRGVHIPKSFSRFQGYNVPELTKHRKRSATNMSSSVLESLSTKLFRVLQSSFTQRPQWLELKGDLEELAHSLSKYSEMLQDKNKTMKLVHTSTVPW